MEYYILFCHFEQMIFNHFVAISYIYKKVSSRQQCVCSEKIIIQQECFLIL